MQWFTLITGIASVAGFVFSLKAWMEARNAAKKATEARDRASEAAREARDAITVRTLVDEFQLACERVDQLLDFLSHDRLSEASLRAHELASSLSEIRFRRSPYLSEERKDDLLTARQEARILSQVLASGWQTPFSNEQKQKLIRQCEKISTVLRENLGTIKGEIDRGAKL